MRWRLHLEPKQIELKLIKKENLKMNTVREKRTIFPAELFQFRWWCSLLIEIDVEINLNYLTEIYLLP